MANSYFCQWPYLNDVHELTQTVLASKRLCTCPTCQPSLYGENCCKNSHLQIHQHAHNTRSKASPDVMHAQEYEALYLVRASIEYFSRPEDQMNSVQREALQRLRSMSLRQLGWQNGAKALGRDQLQNIVECFNRIFFFGAVKVDIMWKDSEGLLGFYECGEVKTDPIMTDSLETEDYDGRRLNRLGTILHEAAHAFLDQLVCQHCPTFAENIINADKHGRAWQVLVLALSDATHSLFGEWFDVGGFEDIRYNWEYVNYLPSVHDLEQWRLYKSS